MPKATRRDAMLFGVGSLLASAGAKAVTAAPPPPTQHVNRLGAWRRGLDGQRRADLGDGTYLNPIFAGDHPEPTVLKDGADYYATFASADYHPGPVLWHSLDLLNWTPIGPLLKRPIGIVHGPELVCHDGRYFLYMAVSPSTGPADLGGDPERRTQSTIFVIHASDIRGPWSDPVSLGLVGRADPAHVVDTNGARYLFLDNGYRVTLRNDGLAVSGKPSRIYQGWPIPEEFINEGFCLDAVKIIRRGDYYYLFAAEGGTAGPANGHLVAVARSPSIDGPWENSPRNPLVRADARDDPWWSRGRAVPVEGPDGRWWIVYHAYEKNLRSLGRQTILEPIEWQADGWPKALGGILDAPLPSPTKAGQGSHGNALAGPFAPDDFGKRFAFYRPQTGFEDRVVISDGALWMKGQGAGPSDASPLAMIAGDRRYDMSVEIARHGNSQAGLLLFYNEHLFCGLGAAEGTLFRYKLGHHMTYPPIQHILADRFYLRILYKEDVASFFTSSDRQIWKRVMTFDVAGYNHNMAGGLLSLRPAMFVAGDGEAEFRALEYNGAI